MKGRFVATGVLAASTVVLVAFGYVKWRAHVVRSQDRRNFQSASQLFRDAQFDEALATIRSGQRAAEFSGLAIERWLTLHVKTLEKMRHVPRLTQFYRRYPQHVERNEKASLLMARAQLKGGDPAIVERLANRWREKTSHAEAWFAIRADALLNEGRIDEARALLESRSFPGAADCGRLARLALLEANTDPQRAWELLQRAFRSDPRNPDVRSFRAQILEALDEYGEARLEYVAAHVARADNPVLADQLAEFYRRRGNYGAALQTWLSVLSPPSLDSIWLKTAFWSRVARPVNVRINAGRIPAGDLKALVRYVLELPPGEYWDDSRFARLFEARRYQIERQETFWLRLLQLLKTGRETEALQSLKQNRFRRRSFNAELEDALAWIVAYRQGALANWASAHVIDPPQHDKPRHPFFKRLAEWSERCGRDGAESDPPKELKPLLDSDEVFSATLLAGAWPAAALQLSPRKVIPESFPDWFAYGMTQALRYNRGNQAALDFAVRQPETPLMTLLIGELLLATRRASEGLDKLEALAEEDSDAGFRAAWLASLARLKAREFARAERIVRASPRLAESVTGKEILARLALLGGRSAEATKAYRHLGNESTEAMAYLAREAFARKNWKEARRLTLVLLERLPDELQLRANLAAIDRAEQGP